MMLLKVWPNTSLIVLTADRQSYFSFVTLLTTRPGNPSTSVSMVSDVHPKSDN